MKREESPERKKERGKEGQGGRGGRWRRGGGDTAPVTLHYIVLFHRFLRSVRFLSREWNLLRYARTGVTHLCTPHGLPVWLPLMFPELRIIPE